MAQIEKAAAFMRDLTRGVAALLDSFDKGNRNRAAALRKQFAAYAGDRRDAIAIWRGSSRRGHQGSAQTTEASHRPAADSAKLHAESPASAGTHAEAHAAAGTPAHTANAPAHSSQPPIGNLGQPSSKGHHGGHSK